jgi:hypothetical protein
MQVQRTAQPSLTGAIHDRTLRSKTGATQFQQEGCAREWDLMMHRGILRLQTIRFELSLAKEGQSRLPGLSLNHANCGKHFDTSGTESAAHWSKSKKRKPAGDGLQCLLNQFRTAARG